jgi:hypothetical protein
MMSTENADPSTAASDQPATTRSLSWLLATVVSVLLGLVSAGVMTAAMFWIGDYYRGSQVSRDEEGRRKLQELRAAEQKELQTYGWINRTDGVVRIPIDRAMQLLAEEAQPQEPSPPTSRSEQPPSR